MKDRLCLPAGGVWSLQRPNRQPMLTATSNTENYSIPPNKSPILYIVFLLASSPPFLDPPNAHALLVDPPVHSYISDNGLVHATIVFPTIPCFTLQSILLARLACRPCLGWEVKPGDKLSCFADAIHPPVPLQAFATWVSCRPLARSQMCATMPPSHAFFGVALHR